jgi:aspartate kinase
MSNLSVIKFGGTSLADFAGMSRCADIVKKTPSAKVIVVSAIANTTRLLLKSISEPDVIDEIKDRHYKILNSFHDPSAIKDKLDMLLENTRFPAFAGNDSEQLAELLALGEQMSSLLFTELLNEQGISVVNFDVRKVIKTNSNSMLAEPNIKEIKKNCAKYLLPLDQVVTQGFIGSDANGLTTTLGMESSDYSAALLAEALEADHFAIWTDVPGILTTDPKITTKARPIPELSFAEAAELTKFGAKVLHPATLEPAIRNNIKFCVGFSQNPEQKTWVTDKKTANTPALCAISLKLANNSALIALIGSNMHKHQIIKDKLANFLKNNNYTAHPHSICFSVNSSIAEDVVRQLHDILFEFKREHK